MSAAAPILPPATIGMLGGGQLGRYALMAARTMGYRTVVLDPDPSAPAGAVSDEHLVAAYDDAAALQRMSEVCDVVTTEFENPPAEALDTLARSVRVAPSARAVRIAQDRAAEKRFFDEGSFPVAPYGVLGETSAQTVQSLPVGLVGKNVVIKTARLGYDGKGQRRLEADNAEGAGDLDRWRGALDAAWSELGRVPCVVEMLVDLATEVSVIVARSHSGDTLTWPMAENTHAAGILDVSIVPAAIDAELVTAAESLAVEIATRLDYVGVLAVEMFVVRSHGGAFELLVNEMAPRPHNSGHWTLDGSVTSQYEQQIRAICGLGLGDTSMTAPGVAMVNLLGHLWADGPPAWHHALAVPAAKLHLYGKSEARPGRKMGHLTVLGESAAAARRRATSIRDEL